MLVVWQTVALALVAGWLLHRGLRGTRVGDEPRCRKCDYRLDGLTSQQCPECGTAIAERTVVHGTRVVRRIALAGAVVLVFLWLPMMDTLWSVRNVNWFPYLSNSYCLWFADQDRELAAKELALRIREEQLDQQTVDQALRLLTRRMSQGSLDPSWQDILGALRSCRFLSPDQQSALYRNAPLLSVEHRSLVRQGDPLAVKVTLSGSSFPPLGRQAFDDIWVDGHRIEGTARLFRRYYAPDSSNPPTFLPGGLATIGTGNWTPGLHTVAILVSTGGYSIVSNHPPRKSSATFTVQVLPVEHSPLVHWSQTEFDSAKIQSSLAVGIGKIHRISDHERGFEITVDLHSALPVPVAFELALEIDGHEISKEETLGATSPVESRPYLAWNAGETGKCILYEAVQLRNAEEINVILRGSRSTAMQHPSIPEVWKGELRFGPFAWAPRSAFQHGLSNMNP